MKATQEPDFLALLGGGFLHDRAPATDDFYGLTATMLSAVAACIADSKVRPVIVLAALLGTNKMSSASSGISGALA